MREKDRYWDFLDQAVEASRGGHIDEALDWLEKALEVHPEGAEAHNVRGEIFWEEGRTEEALQEFERAVRADPKLVDAHLNRAELLIEEMGAFEEAIAQCDALLAGGPELPRLDRSREAEVYYLKSKALFYQDDLEGALFLVRRALQTGGELGVYRVFEGQILFELARFEEAHGRLERGLSLEPDSAHGLYYLGLTLERLGRTGEAREAFERAHALDPERYPLPVEIDAEAFERAAHEALANIPRSLRERIENVPVLIEDFPSQELLERENISPQILGIYLGTPPTEAGATEQPADLNRIVLFKKNLEKVCRDREDLIEQIEVTIKHEVGHALGLSEERLEQLGLA